MQRQHKTQARGRKIAYKVAWGTGVILVLSFLMFLGLCVRIEYSETMSGMYPGEELHAAIESSAPMSEIREIVQSNFLAVHSSYKGYETALHWAAAEGRVDLVPVFLEVTLPFDNDFRSRIYAFNGMRGDTPLHSAIRHGHADIVQLLLDNGANPNQSQGGDMTPLEFAESLDMTEIVELLKDR